ncbi:MAG: RNA 2'-phosphotransferase [Cyanobacteria bacterium SBC]|nr:RNA 2'-phosphotransferase [Cyanobacteria bacterium SBC]
MLSRNRLVKVSKSLSYYLRHHPEELGLTLEVGGWVSVEKLLAVYPFSLSREELQEVVDFNDKQRFSFDETGHKIRANQGHSITVDLQLTPTRPPAVLYHGTAAQWVESILDRGLQKMSRHHVHLSKDRSTAYQVGQRHGKPIVFQVNAAIMYDRDFTFYQSKNGVWLVDAVPPEYLTQLS